MLARRKRTDSGADFFDDGGEFMTKGDGYGVPGYGVRLGGRKGGSTEVFVQIRAADSDVCGGDLLEN